jgi:hypothetical protein
VQKRTLTKKGPTGSLHATAAAVETTTRHEGSAAILEDYKGQCNKALESQEESKIVDSKTIIISSTMQLSHCWVQEA